MAHGKILDSKKIPSFLNMKNCINLAVFTVLLSLFIYLASNTLEHLNDLSERTHQAKFQGNKPPFLNNSTNGLQWFVQLSDIHISRYYDKKRSSDLQMFCTKYLDFIQPDSLIITGDLTDAKHADHMGSEQYLDEWQAYNNIVKNYCSRRTTLLDIRGNHDTFNVGGEKSSTNYYKNYSLRGNKLQSYFHRQGNVTFIAMDVALNIGLKRPFNFFGYLDENNHKLAEKHVADAEKRGDTIVFFGHFPASTVVGEKYHMKSLISKAGFYLCGHLHNLLGFLPEMYTSHRRGNMELELADWKDNRAYRIFAVDNGLFSFVDRTLSDDFPIILITNPKHSQFNSPKYEPTEKMLFSTHVRILIFSPFVIDKVTVSVDGYKLGNAKQTKKTPLYTIPWDAKNFKKGMHKISVDVKQGNRAWKHEQPFSLDNSRIPFPLRARYILMADHRLVARWLFFFTELFLIVPLLILRHPTLKRYIMLHSDNSWIRRISSLATDNTLCSILIGWALYIYIGPWFIGELIDGHWGIVCFYGAFTYRYGAVPLPSSPFFALTQLWSMNVPLYLWSAFMLKKQVRWKSTLFIGLLIWWQLYLAWTGFGRAYGIIAAVLCPLRTGSACIAILVYWILKKKNKF